jgi:hypothetical protein
VARFIFLDHLISHHRRFLAPGFRRQQYRLAILRAVDADAIAIQRRTIAEVQLTCRIEAVPAAVDDAVVIPSASSYLPHGASIKRFAIRSF